MSSSPSFTSDLFPLNTFRSFVHLLPGCALTLLISLDTEIMPTIHLQIMAFLLEVFNPIDGFVLDVFDFFSSRIFMSCYDDTLRNRPFPNILVLLAFLSPGTAKSQTSFVVTFTLHSFTKISPSAMFRNPVIGQVCVSFPISIKDVWFNRSSIGDWCWNNILCVLVIRTCWFMNFMTLEWDNMLCLSLWSFNRVLCVSDCLRSNLVLTWWKNLFWSWDLSRKVSSGQFESELLSSFGHCWYLVVHACICLAHLWAKNCSGCKN